MILNPTVAYLWAYPKGSLKVTPARGHPIGYAHQHWFEQKGWPVAGREFDRIKRGHFYVKRKEKELYIVSWVGEAPNELGRWIRAKWPKENFEDYEVEYQTMNPSKSKGTRARGNPLMPHSTKFLHRKPLASVTDKGYTMWIVLGAEGGDPSMPPVGTEYIKENKTGRVTFAGYWMDWPESDMSQRAYDKMPIAKRAKLELGYQKDVHGLKNNFEAHVGYGDEIDLKKNPVEFAVPLVQGIATGTGFGIAAGITAPFAVKAGRKILRGAKGRKNPQDNKVKLSGLTIQKMGNGWYAAFHNGVNIGNVMLNDEETYAISVLIEPPYRGKGVASKLYKFIEKDLGRKLQQSPHQTPSGKSFWESRGNPGDNEQAFLIQNKYEGKGKSRKAMTGGKLIYLEPKYLDEWIAAEFSRETRYGPVKVWNFAFDSNGMGSRTTLYRTYSESKLQDMEAEYFAIEENPSPNSAQSLSEEFHGRPSTDIQEFEQSEEYHDELAGLGSLTELEVVTSNGRFKTPLDFSGDGVSLASTPDGKQLHFVGGEQGLDDNFLKAMGLSKAEIDKDSVKLGMVHTISYFADKHHLTGSRSQKDGTEYIHEFGEAGGSKPMLVYDKLNERLELVGGTYVVRGEGVVN